MGPCLAWTRATPLRSFRVYSVSEDWPEVVRRSLAAVPRVTPPADRGFALQLVPPARRSLAEMIPFPFFQVFAATDATTSGIGGSHAESELSDFPGEHPSDKDLTDWLDAVHCLNCAAPMARYCVAKRHSTCCSMKVVRTI